MSNEVKLSASVGYTDSEYADEALAIVDRIAGSSGKRYTKAKQNIGTAEEAINLGEVAALGVALFVNRDPTNFVELRVSTGGAKFARLDPDVNGNGTGGFAMLRLGSGAQVPYAIADTATCRIEYFIIEQ